MVVRFPMEYSIDDSIGKIPIGFNPTNLTASVRKNHKDPYPPKYHENPLKRRPNGGRED